MVGVSPIWNALITPRRITGQQLARVAIEGLSNERARRNPRSALMVGERDFTKR